MKRNKIRYQSKEQERILITISGEVFLQYADDDAIDDAAKGDLTLYPQNDALNSTRVGEYDGTGFAGYFKLEIYDGKQWCLVLVNDIFSHNEHHFSKKERPIDTYAICKEILANLKGKSLLRTYREHYTLS